MIPIFTSHYSFKSILTLDDSSVENGSDSIITICKENNISTCFLLENTCSGDLSAFNAFAKANIIFRFGLSVTMEDQSRINLWAKTGSAMSVLRKIHSCQYYYGAKEEYDGDELKSVSNGKLSYSDLEKLYNPELIQATIPFYDSFLFKNWFYINSNCVPNLNFLVNPIFFIENHSLPFDTLYGDFLVDYAQKNGFQTENVYSIFYKDIKDFDAYVTYRITLGRKNNHNATIHAPGIEHMGGLFCWEDYLERNKK